MRYKFIDLFSGIGGFRLGFEKKDFQCVYSSEINEHAREMYFENFGEFPAGDVTKINEKDIPEHDVLCAGFPCQPFSIAGDKKGFEDTRGTLFFDIIRILKEKKPKAVILENVKHFKNHDKGRTLQVILNSLKEIGYTTNWKVLNAKDFGIPQNRERTIIVGFLDNKKFDFNLLNQLSNNILENILEESNNEFEFLNENEYNCVE